MTVLLGRGNAGLVLCSADLHSGGRTAQAGAGDCQCHALHPNLSGVQVVSWAQRRGGQKPAAAQLQRRLTRAAFGQTSLPGQACCPAIAPAGQLGGRRWVEAPLLPGRPASLARAGPPEASWRPRLQEPLHTSPHITLVSYHVCTVQPSSDPCSTTVRPAQLQGIGLMLALFAAPARSGDVHKSSLRVDDARHKRHSASRPFLLRLTHCVEAVKRPKLCVL